LSNRPNPIALAAIVVRKISVVRRPRTFHRVVNVAAFVAGPAMRKAKTAPNDTPTCSSPAAIGTDAVAQTYIGIPAAIMIRIDTIPPPMYAEIPPTGTRALIAPAISIPTINAGPISLGRVTNP
jgi:hypothetical protein